MQLTIPQNILDNWNIWYGPQQALVHQQDVLARTQQALDDWQLQATTIILGGGISLLVADQQQQQVVKVTPGSEISSQHEAAALQAWSGPGVMEVLDVHTNGAILFPYYPQPVSAAQHTNNDRLQIATILGQASKLVHDRSPSATTLMAQYQQWQPYAFAHKSLFDERWDGPITAFYEQIKQRCDELLLSTDEFVLLHTDLTASNILYTGNDAEPYLVLDPKPAFGDRHAEIFGVQTLLTGQETYTDMDEAVQATLQAFTDGNGYDVDRCRQWLLVKVSCHYLELLLQPEIPDADQKAAVYQQLMHACS